MLRILVNKLRKPSGHPEEGATILHISDTPWTVFPFVERLIRRFHPAWIVHTGDLVDGVKLGLYPQAENIYCRRAGRIIRAMEQNSTHVYLVMGNHDLPDFVRQTARTGRVIEDVAVLDLGGLTVRVSHYPERILQDPAPYNLFGHSRELKSGVREGGTFLNGLEHAHLIYPKTGRITNIRYPWGTDDARMMRRRFKP